MFADPRKAYLVLGAEPEFDCANPVAARAALEKAEFVVVMSPFRHGTQYADALLPISPFTETAGTFVNCEGRAQAFNGVVKPLGETRPAWKVLRVLGSLLGAARDSISNRSTTCARRCPRPATSRRSSPTARASRSRRRRPRRAGIERVADVPIHFADPLVRRAPSLQQTADAKPPRARMNALTLAAARRRGGRAGQGPAGPRRGGADRRCRRRRARRASCASPPRIRRPAGSKACPGPITVERA